MITQIKVATLRDIPADPIMHAQGRPMIGVQQFILHNKDTHICIPLFLERNGGQVQRFLLVKAYIAEPLTKESSQQLQPVWLLVPGNPRVSHGNDGVTYIADQSEGMINNHHRMLADVSSKSCWNSITAMVTLRDMPVVPNAAYLTNPGEWSKDVWPLLRLQHGFLCGGIRKAGDGTEEVKPLLNGTEEMDAFMKQGHSDTELLLRTMLRQGKGEPNTVFELLPNTIQAGEVPYYNTPVGNTLVQQPFTGVRRFSTISNWNGTVKVDTGTAKFKTGTDKELTAGVRNTGGASPKWSFDRLITVYDRRMNVVNAARLSLIDPVTIRYLEGQEHKSDVNPEDVVDIGNAKNRKSRAKTLEDVVQVNQFIQLHNASIKVRPNKRNEHSMAIVVEFVIGDHGSYVGIRDSSKLGNVGQVADTASAVATLMTDDVLDFEEIMKGTNAVEKVAVEEPKDAPAPEPVGDMMGDELPF